MIQIDSNVSLASYTSWLIGGAAEHFCLPTSLLELQEAVRWAQEHKKEITVLSGGSNVLISDAGIKGLTICLRKFSGTEVQEDGRLLRITALSGTGKSELLKIYLKHKLAPALFLAGIPGDVGGGVAMNAGVSESMKPREFCEIVEWVEVLKPDLTVQTYKHSEIDWSYRHSSGWQPGIVTRVGLVWQREPDFQILEKVRDANKIRLQKQPLDKPSCGSVFVNPPGHKAAQLIDQCSLKGHQIGGAQVSTKHANFIVNLGNATAQDVWQLIEFVKATVLQKAKVQMKTEVVRLGF